MNSNRSGTGVANGHPQEPTMATEKKATESKQSVATGSRDDIVNPPGKAETNGHIERSVPNPAASAIQAPQGKSGSQTSPNPKPKRKKKPNYAALHSRPIPLETHPLPTFHPSNPLSLLHLLATYLSQLLYPPSSHPSPLYTAAFSPETRSVHVTDPRSIKALWEMGFFGKGSLSRSELKWAERERARQREARAAAEAEGSKKGSARRPVVPEEVTRARREERRLFKLERARAEREKIARQKAVEQGIGVVVEEKEEERKGDVEVKEAANGDGEHVAESSAKSTIKMNDHLHTEQTQNLDAEVVDRLRTSAKPKTLASDDAGTNGHIPPTKTSEDADSEEDIEQDEPIKDQEHLQLTFEEAFFLAYALGVLAIKTPGPPDSEKASAIELLHLFATYCTFGDSLQSSKVGSKPTRPNNEQRLHTLLPSAPVSIASIAPDNPFLLSYATYHHFRSLGWVVRPGIKFGVDYLLYNRGPVFSHAEFAIIIIPAYSHNYWSMAVGQSQRSQQARAKDWWWLHTVNRVQSHVMKTLVLCYVDVPPPLEESLPEDPSGVTTLLKRYKIREFVVRRWSLNRMRG